MPLLERGPAIIAARFSGSAPAAVLAPLTRRLLGLRRRNVNRSQVAHDFFRVELAGFVAERVQAGVLHEAVAEVGWQHCADDPAELLGLVGVVTDG